MAIRQALRARILIPISLLLLLAHSGAAGAAESWHSQRHADCLTEAAADPEAAFDSALGWEAAGGGAAARHCIAVALIGLGAYVEAAKELEALVNETPDPSPEGRAALLAEAGNAWVLADDLERAIAAFDAAIELVPQAPGLYVDRGLALALAGDLWQAVDDLNRAEDLEPDRIDVLVYRATAYRYLEAYELAAADLERAIALYPENPDAYLERGQLRRALGDLAGARRDFLQVLRLDPDGPIAEDARQAIEAMDLKVED